MQLVVGRAVDPIELSCEFFVVWMCVCRIRVIGLEEKEQDDNAVVHLGR